MSYFFHGCRGSFSYRKFLTKQFIFIALCNLHTDLDVFCIISEIEILFHCTDVSFSLISQFNAKVVAIFTKQSPFMMSNALLE